jgi:GntR family transcriptional regulator
VNDTSGALHEVVTAPKYQSVHDALVVMMESLAPGTAMPTERELCLQFSVSRATVRQALGQLEIEQRIYRRQGKGTFVARPKIEQSLELMSHTEGMRARGITPSSKLIDVRRVAAGAEVGARLDLSPKAEVLRVERLRLADEEPIAIEVVFLNAERFDGITAALSDGASLYQLFSSNYGVELASAEETIEAVIAEGREAGLLRCQPGMPLLMLSRRTLDTAGQPIEFVRSLYRGDRYRFQTGLRRPHVAGLSEKKDSLTLRSAREPDAASLAHVFIQAWRGAYRGIVEDAIIDGLVEDEVRSWMHDLVSSTTASTVVAVHGDTVVGFARFGEDPDDPQGGHLYALYVLPTASGQGVGKALLAHVLSSLDPTSTRPVTLWVFEKNERAQGLYRSFGFELDGEQRVEEEWRAPEVHMRRVASTGDSLREGVRSQSEMATT